MEGIEQKPTESEGLPDGVEVFMNQVAGHKHGKGRWGLGILKHKNGPILKPLFEDNGRAVKELSFYENVFQNSDSDPLLKELKDFLPVFYGTKLLHISGKDIKYLCVEDVSGKFQNPSVLDVKIGPITYEVSASEQKIISQKSKFPHGSTCGIRIVGMKVYDEEKQIHVAQERTFLRQLSPNTIASALSLYFTKDKFINSLLLSGFIHKLTQLDSWFSRQRKFKFISSSMLFVYESTLSFWRTWIQERNLNSSLNNLQNSIDQNSTSSLECLSNNSKSTPGIGDSCPLCGLDIYTCTQAQTKCDLFRVVMIDFAHCSPSEKEDTNFIFGLCKLINHFKNLIEVQIADL